MFNPEATAVEGVPEVHGPPAGAGLSCVLERGLDSQGSPPLTLVGGEQQGPISLGRAGQFRVDGRGVLAIHGYLMFDGEGVYLCSADEANPIVADGARIPRDWTPVGVPCSLLFGRARALLRGSTPAAPPRPPRARAAAQASDEDDEWDGASTPGAGAVADPLDEAETPHDGVPHAGAQPPARSSAAPPRPRLRSHTDDESTRVGADGRGVSVVRGAPGDHEATRMNTGVRRSAPTPEPQPPFAPSPQAPPPQYVEPFTAPHTPSFDPQAYGATAVLGADPQGMPPPQAPYMPATGYGPPGPSAPFGPPAGYAPPPAIAPKPASALQRASAALREGLAPGSPRRKPLLILACGSVALVVVTVVTVLRVHAARSAALAAAPPPSVPAQVEPPQGTVAAPIAAGVVLYPAPPRAPVDAGVDPTARPRPGKPAPPPPATLERTAVDAVNRGDLAGALAIYRQLAQQQPDNPAFANAVKLLQQRPGAGGAAP